MSAAVSSVGPYRIVDKLGGGAMGDVFLAEDTRLGRHVALKTVSAQRASTTAARRQLMREARAAALVNHPNVASIYDVVESADSVHIVMEYVRGETLASRARRGPLSADAVVRLGIQLADALAAAHGMGVIHRDLKPGNVMVTPEGTVKVLDFGLAETPVGWLAGSETPTQERTVKEHGLAGTPPYIPPERFLGQPPSILGDIYSLGVTLFEMAAGRRPFVGRDMATIGRAVLSDPVPRICDINPAMPSQLDTIVSRAMARRPDQRFASAADLATALREEQDRLSEATVSGDRWAWRAPGSRWSRPASIGTALVCAAVSGAAIWALLRGPQAPPAAQSAVVAVLPLVNATGDAGSDPLGVGVADVLTTTLARLPGVTMVARDDSLRHRPGERDLTRLARDLGADLVVDGAVQKSGNTVRVTVSLVRPASRRVVWSGTYDGPLDDLLSVQGQAAQALADALQLTLTPAQRQRAARPPTANVEALADYVQGCSFLERPDVEGNVDRAITLFRSAVARDRRYAQAYAGLGRAHWTKFEQTRDPRSSDAALLETIEALRLDPEDATARHALAVIYAGTGRTEQAIEELRRAIALQPAGDEAHSLLGKLLGDQGRREESVAELRRAIALRPNYWRHHYQLAVAYFDAGRFREAQAAARRVAELQPDSSRGLMLLGTAQYAGGSVEQAIATFRQALSVRPDSAIYTNLGNALMAAGRLRDAAEAFEEAARLSSRSPFKHRNLADVYERLGQGNRARTSHARTIELCRSVLESNPRDARILSLLSFSEIKLGRTAEGLRHAEEAVDAGAQMADVLYNRAVVLTLAGRPSEGLLALGQALAAGYSRAQAREDENLAPLRERAEFQQLTTDAARGARKGEGR